MEDFEVRMYCGQRDANGNMVFTIMTFGLGYPTEYEFNYGGNNEEGYSHTELRVRICPEDSSLIELDSHTNARDCDGPIDTYTNMVAAISGIDEKGHAEWTKEKTRVHDAYAQSMGY